jgi:M6 family metalloprotease-like protein
MKRSRKGTTLSAIFNERVTLGQVDGSEIRLRVTGDEFYAVYESADGYTAVNDVGRGMFCHAYLHKGRLKSSGVAISEEPPAGSARHLRETPGVREAGRDRHVFRLGGEFSRGRVCGLTILVEFQDVRTTTTAKDISDMLNGESYTRNGNFCSVREYFRTMSSGKLDYVNEVFGPYRLNRNRGFYIHHSMAQEVLDLALSAGLDIRACAINILYAGTSQYVGALWPRCGFFGQGGSDISPRTYLMSGAGAGGDDLSIGEFCHETGHQLCGFPDLYDRGFCDSAQVGSRGVGVYCLMGFGGLLNRGRAPSPVCAYLRDLAGWCDDEIVLNSAFEVQALHGAYDTLLKFKTPAPNEYFVVENRARRGLDRFLPSSGLAVYHCDSAGGPHDPCTLLQADGRLGLERNAHCGDEGDLFSSIRGVAASHATSPSTCLWGGDDSGLVISRVSAAGERMSFRIGIGPIKGETAPRSLLAPRTSVASVITIPDAGTVGDLKVAIDITHPHVGYLSFILVSPSWKEVELNCFDNTDAGGLLLTQDSKVPSPLMSMIGQSVKGSWTLLIADRGTGAPAYTGFFNKWSLEIAPAL